MLPLLFTTLVGLLFNLFFAGELTNLNKLDGTAPISISAASVNP